jgi:hypothetical protein
MGDTLQPILDSLFTLVESNATILNAETYWYNNNWVIEFFGGLVTSLFIVLFLRLLRPRVEISNYIANTDGILVFKFINKGWFSISDVRLEASLVKPVGAPKGTNLRCKILKLDFNAIDSIPSRYSKRGKEHSRFATQVKIIEDINDLWDDSAHLEFVVISRHGFSNNKRITIEKYNHKKSVIKEGAFETGNSVKIKPC